MRIGTRIVRATPSGVGPRVGVGLAVSVGVGVRLGVAPAESAGLRVGLGVPRPCVPRLSTTAPVSLPVDPGVAAAVARPRAAVELVIARDAGVGGAVCVTAGVIVAVGVDVCVGKIGVLVWVGRFPASCADFAGRQPLSATAKTKANSRKAMQRTYPWTPLCHKPLGATGREGISPRGKRWLTFKEPAIAKSIVQGHGSVKASAPVRNTTSPTRTLAICPCFARKKS